MEYSLTSGVAVGGRKRYLQCNRFNYILFLAFWPSNSYPSDFLVLQHSVCFVFVVCCS